MLLVIFSVAVGFCFALVPFLIIEIDKIIEIILYECLFLFNVHLIMSFSFSILLSSLWYGIASFWRDGVVASRRSWLPIQLVSGAATSFRRSYV